MTDNAQKVSLLNCHSGGSHYNFSCNFAITKYKPQHIIVGKYLNGFNEPVFSKLQVHTPILNSWLFPGMIHSSTLFGKETEQAEVFSWQLKSDDPDSLKYEVEIDDIMKLSLRGIAEFSTGFAHLNVSISQSTVVEFSRIANKGNLNEFHHYMFLFLQFLSFASLTPVHPSKLIFYDDDYHQEVKGDKHLRPIYWYYIDREESSVIKSVKDIYFLFSYKHISDVVTGLIKKWYNDSDSIAPIRYHLINSIKTKPYFDSSDFLIIIQALEGYHRRFVDKKKKSLKDRLAYLVDDFQFVKRLKITQDDIEAAVQSRDYYSHFFDRSEKPQLREGFELFHLHNQLRILLICCVLRLIGIKDDLIEKLLQDCNNKLLASWK